MVGKELECFGVRNRFRDTGIEGSVGVGLIGRSAIGVRVIAVVLGRSFDRVQGTRVGRVRWLDRVRVVRGTRVVRVAVGAWVGAHCGVGRLVAPVRRRRLGGAVFFEVNELALDCEVGRQSGL